MTSQRPHRADLADLPLEVSGTPLPGCNPAWWSSEAAARASHARCVSPEEALDVEVGRRLMLACPCVCHEGGDPPMPYRPAPGPNAIAIRPWLASQPRRWSSRTEGGNP